MNETVGHKLIKARNKRGVSLEDAARTTRIKIDYLKALEADDQASLPSTAHTRGFLRLYADYLGLDQGEVLAGDAPKAVIRQPVFKAPKKEPKETPLEPSETKTPASDNPTITAETVNTQNEPLLTRPVTKPDRIIQYPPTGAEEIIPKTSQELVYEIGNTLKERRESLNLSLEEVERITHLRLHHLKTLESGRMEDLASPTQARGMLSNYARFLNLDDEKLLLDYANALQTRRVEKLTTKPRESRTKSVTRPGLKNIISLDLVIGSLLIIAMAAFLIWGLSKVVDSQKQASIQPTLPPVSEVLAITLTNTPGAAAPSQLGTTTLLPGNSRVTSDSNQVTINPTLAGAQPVNIAQTPAAGGKSTANEPIQVYVIARNSAWMKVTVDGQVTFIGRIIPGNAYTYAANKKLEVVTGDAAAIQILYNQNDLGSLGVVDQVIDLIFTDKGLVNPTPTITPTPTRILTSTSGPSPTPTPSAIGSTITPSSSKPTTTATIIKSYSPTVKQ